MVSHLHRSLSMTLVMVTLFFAPPLCALEKFERLLCDSDNNGAPQSLELTIEDERIISFDYTSSIRSGDTFLMCSFAAKRDSKETVWNDDGGVITIEFKEGAGEEDQASLSQKRIPTHLSLRCRRRTVAIRHRSRQK